VRELRANPQFEAAALSDRFNMTFAGGGQSKWTDKII